MKKLLIFIPLLLLSCKSDYKVAKTVAVEYEDGEKDTLVNPYIKSSRTRDKNGDYRKIVSKEVIKIDTIRNAVK